MGSQSVETKKEAYMSQSNLLYLNPDIPTFM